MQMKVIAGFRIDRALLDQYESKAAAAREQTKPGQLKPPRQPTWVKEGAVYLAGDTIEVVPLEAIELLVIAPAGALEPVEVDHV